MTAGNHRAENAQFRAPSTWLTDAFISTLWRFHVHGRSPRGVRKGSLGNMLRPVGACALTTGCCVLLLSGCSTSTVAPDPPAAARSVAAKLTGDASRLCTREAEGQANVSRFTRTEVTSAGISAGDYQVIVNGTAAFDTKTLDGHPILYVGTWECVVQDGGVVSFKVSDPPPEVLAPGWGRAVDAVDSCVIKGNISYNTGERIYHVPGQEFYESTVINESYGERWFCSEGEARAAGWRKSRA